MRWVTGSVWDDPAWGEPGNRDPGHDPGAGDPAHDPARDAGDAAAELAQAWTELLDRFGLGEVAANLDPLALAPVLARASASLSMRPFDVARATLDYVGATGQATFASVMRGLGVDVDGPAAPPDDRRYRDPAYTENAWFYLCRQQHALLGDHLRALVAAADLDPADRRKTEFAVEQLVAALAPANFLLGNPSALKRAFDTGGRSLALGLGNLARDLMTNGGAPRQVAPEAFTVGADLAATPGRVVYRNRLIELIQYLPATDTVHRVPMLFSPPWINKYYVLDLAPGKSLVEWAVRHGHTCFAISYRNPDESLRDVGMSEYLRESMLAAIQVVADITGEPEVHVVALCLGGTLAAATAAWLAEGGERGIAALTLTNTLLDFADPGPLGLFTDEAATANLERMMRRPGYLSERVMKATFDALRPTELVWDYLVANWLMGEEPPSFDLLAWNADSTRMPLAMHLEYLRTCYQGNQLASGEMTLAGRRLDLGAVRAPAYFVTAEADHIAPWRSVFAGARRLGGPVRFVMSNSGHIAGVVNPPGGRCRYWLSASDTDALPAEPSGWRADATEHPGSWWEDWTRWAAARGGERRPPPAMGSATHPPTLDAPGGYVHT